MRKQPGISQQIKRYLNGELDARAMHELERRAQDDPFLMDALEGFENNGINANAGIDDLHNRLQQRTAEKEVRDFPWRAMGIAASILLLLGIGLFWYEEREPVTIVQNKVALMPPKATEPAMQKAAPTIVDTSNGKVGSAASKNFVNDNRFAVHKITHRSVAPATHADEMAAAPPVGKYDPVSEQAVASNNKKPDTAMPLDEMVAVEYSASKKAVTQYKKTNNNVDTTGYHAFSGGQVTTLQLNGKAYRQDSVKGFIQPIKGTDIARLHESLYGYNAASNQAGMMMIGKALNYPQPGSNNVNKPHSYAMGENSRSMFTQKASAGNSTFAPLNPVKLHGNLLKGMVKATGEPLAYATVKIKGTTISTLTDANGLFTLYSVPDSAILEVIADGYRAREIKVGKRAMQVVALRPLPFAATDAAATDDKDPQDEYQPHPFNGWDNFYSYMQHAAISPDGKKGFVRLSFAVNTDNTLSDFKILKSVSTQTDAAAIKLIKNGPGWYSPADDKAQTVTLNIKFYIRK